MLLLMLGSVRLSGEEGRKEIPIAFRIGNASVDADFGGNAERLDDIVSFLDAVERDSTLDLIEVSFCGYASPDGGIKRNRQLSAQRLASLESYVRARAAVPDSVVTRCEDGFIAWERLASMIDASEMPYKEEAVDVLRNVPEFTYDIRGRLTDSRKARFMNLRGGRSYRYASRHFFGQLRNAAAVIVTVAPKPVPAKEQAPIPGPEETPVVEEPIVVEPTAVPEEPVVEEPATVTALPEPEVSEPRPFYMGVKTNMLYDVLAVPNIGVEFYLKKNWSVSADWMYAWYKTDKRHRYWRVYGGEVAVRRWFGKKADEKPLTGHHAGVYGQLFTFDMEWGGRGYIGGRPGGSLWEKANYAAGLEYGYSLPVARRLNIDFTVGIGYWGGTYYKYIPMDGCYVWQETRNRHYFGPTKAEVSLVWLIGRDNVNTKKGGKK